jgi:glycosyltransferase involved in cell wall biosynthesis
MNVPVIVAARNEARAIGPCLDALLASIPHAIDRYRFELLVVADDCTDDTERIAHARGVRTVRSSGGKVEAQRSGLRASGAGAPFCIFTDADVLVTPPTLAALADAMTARPEAMVAFPPKIPLSPVANTALARAIHLYNRERGFSSQRSWFNGKCFAIRDWHIPTTSELAPRIERLPEDRFYDYAAGMRVDDMYLSRSIVAKHGMSALVETSEGAVYFRAPETWQGMHRYYRRMRMELERVSALFPELDAAHARFGSRSPDRLASASRDERASYALFQSALFFCRAAYRLERVYYQRISRSPCSPWPPIEETKCALATVIPE